MTIDEAAKRLRDAYLDRDKWPNRFDARDKEALEVLLDAVKQVCAGMWRQGAIAMAPAARESQRVGPCCPRCSKPLTGSTRQNAIEAGWPDTNPPMCYPCSSAPNKDAVRTQDRIDRTVDANRKGWR